MVPFSYIDIFMGNGSATGYFLLYNKCHKSVSYRNMSNLLIKMNSIWYLL